jgi:hypothetical protein
VEPASKGSFTNEYQEEGMAHYGVLGKYQFPESKEDIRGAHVYGKNDEKLGKIKDVIFDHTTGDIGYAVVDTGGWLKSKEFLVPANQLRVAAEHRDEFECDCTKQQIESFPAYHQEDLKSEDRWRDYEGRYRAKWETGPVMHRAETDRNITPTTQQMQGNQSSLRAEGGLRRSGAGMGESQREQAADLEAAERSSGRVVPAGTDDVVIDTSAVGIGGRWDTFQARLRQRRKEAVVGCQTCTVGPQSEKGSESAESWKKAI